VALHPPPRSPPVKPHLLYRLPPSVYFWFVVAITIINWQASTAKLYFICDYFFVIQIVALSNGTTSPHSLLPPCTASSTSTLSRSSIAGWLLCSFIKFWPFKAKKHPSLNFQFRRVLFGTPKTSEPTMAPSNPTTVALYGTIGGRGAMRFVGAADLPMEVEGKATGR
jgi:hypothetical protein